MISFVELLDVECVVGSDGEERCEAVGVEWWVEEVEDEG